MLTPWGETLDKSNVLQEYPRPQLRRDSYLNLNGPWAYAVTASPEIPACFDGEILVPFSPESELSGVGHTLQPDEYLWYRRRVTLPAGFRRDRLLLHFGAVDQIATVYADGKALFTHVGGYTPFSLDVTDAVAGDAFELMLCVRDTTDRGDLTCGRQRLRGGGMHQAPQSGIWQTVWMESVPARYIRGLRILPRFDEQKLELWVAGEGECHAEFGGESFDFPAGEPAVLAVAELHPWSPEDPYLYDLYLRLGEDEVESYFAMRKVSAERDESGRMRLFLNGKPYFQNGLLDQGCWSDGLLTAPSDEALIYDITLAKRMGFNLLRKYMKLEPLRWYYHCDRLGMLVWQDMPAGGTRAHAAVRPALSERALRRRDGNYARAGRKREEGRAQYYRELRELLNALVNCPCIAVWVPFSDGLGQFDAAQVCARILETDASRIIDHASGRYDQGIGFLHSRHVYARAFRMAEEPSERAAVLSEFGGYAHRIDGHSRGKKALGCRRFDSANSFKFALRELYQEQLRPACGEGLSAAVYTQLSDVEDALNGLVTYDRRVVKLAPELLRGIVRLP